MRRWLALWLGAVAVVACSGSVASTQSATSLPGTVPPATRTAIAVAITQAPSAARTAVAAVFEAPRSIGTPDYLDPRALATETPRYVGKALTVQGEASMVRERDRVVYFSLLALPRDTNVPQQVNVQSLGETTASVQQGRCYRVEGVGGGTDQSVPFVIAMKIADAPAAPGGGCAAP